MMSEKLTLRMDDIARLLGSLISDFESHDHMERQALGEIQRRSTKNQQ